jgi:hypothetical protein
MKRYAILTSVLALAACGGGSGGGNGGSGSTHFSSAVNKLPPVTMQGFSGGNTVNANNTSLTNMSSYTATYATSESQAKQDMIDYVESKLGDLDLVNRSAIRGANRSSMSPRSGDSSDFYNADVVLTRMKQVLHDMADLSGNDLTNYVNKYKKYVAQSLLLYGQIEAEAVSSMTTTDLINAFNDTGITSENVMSKLDDFDEDNFAIVKERMENIKLIDTGQDAYFKFKLDDNGKISSVSLWENPTTDYGTSWTTGTNRRRIIIATSGEQAGEAIYDTTSNILNPFGNDGDYLNSDAGYLNRNGSGNAFTNTMYHYEFDFGEHNLASVISSDEFSEVEIDSATVLDLAGAKEKLKNYIIEKVNKILHSQPNDDSDSLDGILAVANYYIGLIDGLTTSDIPAYNTFTQTVTMYGEGKNVQLKYSDFGYAKMVRQMGNQTEQQYLTYAGGYDTRNMNSVESDLRLLEDGATFTGTALVTVEDKHKDRNNDDNDYIKSALYKDTTATLTYNVSGGTATHTLTMENLQATEGDNITTNTKDWYTMVVSGTDENPVLSYQFDATDKNIASNYQFFGIDDGNIVRDNSIVATDNSVVNIDKVNGTTVNDNFALYGDATANYYGENPASPTEATSGFYVSERYHSDDNNVQHELAVYGAFGGQKSDE